MENEEQLRRLTKQMYQSGNEKQNENQWNSQKTSIIIIIIIYDTTGEIYVADFQKDCISVFNKEASYIGFAIPGSRDPGIPIHFLPGFEDQSRDSVKY